MNENWTDKLIDAHLEAPNIAEPSLGFESRLLAHVAEQKATRRRPMFWLMWASAAAAVMIAAMVLSRQNVQMPAPVGTAKIAAPLPSAVSRSANATSPLLPRRTASLPRTAVPLVEVANQPAQFFAPAVEDGFFRATVASATNFPSVSPLSDQEQMLVAMVSRMTGQQQRALAEKLEASRIPESLPESGPESSVRPASEIKNTH